ncbi:MAG: DUF4435 domain-containing protein [Mesorhizobium sp.]|uniref:DUF4435 domain-containing protein n=1 Tax=Mesorhizobium sp. TaxID=1871066 RepID=UPI000FE8B688|nr:DUF4435 domain-containing protein [Mesorhizobium sp.]RWF37618.1 MAG: DUF4435 domain-containing protein [Mesorhizobium sp.]
MSMLDEHQAALEVVDEAYHEFLLRYNASNKSVYGFVEGKEDPSFYRSVIERFLPDDWAVELFVSGNRKKVISAEAAFDWNRFSRLQIAFYIDQDLVHFLNPESAYPPNVYVTDGYSIENSIATKEVFVRLLQEVHNVIDWTDLERVSLSQHFVDQLAAFQEMMAPMMAQIAIWRRDGAKANLSNLDLPSIVAFDNGTFSVREGFEQPDARVDRLCQCVGAQGSDAIVRQEMEAAFRGVGGPANLTRGKYLIWFLAMLANEVHARIAKFVASYRAPPKTRMTFGPANVMVVAAPRARIPNSFRLFLESTYIQFIATREGGAA